MAKVQLANVAVLDNPSPFLNPFQFEVTFECIEELKEGTFLYIIFFYKICLQIDVSVIQNEEISKYFWCLC